MENFNLIHLEETLWVLSTHVGVDTYDFDFERFFSCRHPIRIESPIVAVARMGAAQDYVRFYEEMESIGIRLIHTPAQYARSSEFQNWYPLISHLTPRSVWFDAPPSVSDVESLFHWPVFVKGHRQTNRHRKDQCVIESREHFERVMASWSLTPMLAWQKVICREFVPLRQVVPPTDIALAKSFEFRVFCWQGRCAGIGHYWISESYSLTASERREAVLLAELAAKLLELPFIVIDVAQTVDGRWIVIEVNDAQDSGYGGVGPLTLWNQIIDFERDR